MNRLEEEYQRALAEYDEACIQFEKDVVTYQEYSIAHEERCKEYDAAYAIKKQEYDQEFEEYTEALSEYNKLYEESYEKALNTVFEEGVDFDASVAINVDHERENGNIGSEWWHTAEVDGISISLSSYSQKSIVRCAVNQKIKIKSQSVEEDNSPDVGKKNDTYRVTEEDIQNGFEFSHSVTVRENRGRNAGQSVTYVFTYTFKPFDYSGRVRELLSTLPDKPKSPPTPQYDPPNFALKEPVPPIEPIEPTPDDVSIPEPIIEDITLSTKDIYRISDSASASIRTVAILSSLAIVGLVAYWIISKRTYQLTELRTKLNYLKQGKLAIGAEPIPEYSNIPFKEESCEKNNQINRLFLEYLHHLDVSDSANQLLQSAASLQDEVARRKNVELAQLYDAIVKGIQTKVDDSQQAIARISSEILEENNEHVVQLAESFPFQRSPFSPTTDNAELSRLFAGKKLAYDTVDNEVLIFLPQHILQYNASAYHFNILAYRDLRITRINQHTKTLYASPDKDEIIEQSWMYMTKKGLPDKRHTNNPMVYVVYTGILEYVIGSHSATEEFRWSKTIDQRVNEIETYFSTLD